jgi:ribonucleoside-diphosphate reductase beta chain
MAASDVSAPAAAAGASAGSGSIAGKRLLNCSVTDPNRILPIKYGWARQCYETGLANTWVPQEVSMQRDIEMWRSPTELTDAERRVILWNLGFFSTGESMTANNLVLALYRHLTNPECRQYLLRQAFEEAVHTDAFIYVCDALALDPEEIFGMYLTIPTINEKDEFVVDMTRTLLDPDFTTDSAADIQRLVHDLIGFYMIMEGIFFYAGFAMMLSFLRRNKMAGVGEQFWFILRDESVHISFGRHLITGIVDESPEIWTPEFREEIVRNVRRAVDLEDAYARDCLAQGITGITADATRTYLEHIADRRLAQLGLERVYGVENPFGWMSEMTDLAKEKFIFETRVGEYKHASALRWDD